MGGIGFIQDALATIEQGGGLTIMDRGRSEQPQGAVIMLLVVLVKERSDPGPGIFQRTEEVREVRSIFQGLELRLGIRIVIGDAWSRMSLGHAQIGQQHGQRLGLHRTAAALVSL